jgi:hypoxanthine phosphoribosyltransferase
VQAVMSTKHLYNLLILGQECVSEYDKSQFKSIFSNLHARLFENQNNEKNMILMHNINIKNHSSGEMFFDMKQFDEIKLILQNMQQQNHSNDTMFQINNIVLFNMKFAEQSALHEHITAITMLFALINEYLSFDLCLLHNILCMPYIYYCRDSILNKFILKIFAQANIDTIVTLNHHNYRISFETKNCAFLPQIINVEVAEVIQAILADNSIRIDRARYEKSAKFIDAFIDSEFLIAPDVGSYDTCVEIANILQYESKCICAMKKMRQVNNSIQSVAITDLSFFCHGNKIPDSEINIKRDVTTCMIIDDILDSGQTLKAAIIQSKRMGFSKIYVFMTHIIGKDFYISNDGSLIINELSKNYEFFVKNIEGLFYCNCPNKIDSLLSATENSQDKTTNKVFEAVKIDHWALIIDKALSITKTIHNLRKF